jgi:hypothetical protein
VILYDARSRGAEAYISLAHEFLARDLGVATDVSDAGSGGGDDAGGDGGRTDT